MNPFDWTWLWRAARGRSLTFAMVFFLAVAGFPATRLLRRWLASADFSWWWAWLIPILLIGLLAKLEPRLIPSERLRHRLALGLLVGALLILFVIPFPEKPDGVENEREEHLSEEEETPPPRPVHRGPPARR